MSHAENVQERREQLVTLIQDYWEENGTGPTRPELAALSGLSVNTISKHVQALLAEGLLTEDYSGDRSLRWADA